MDTHKKGLSTKTKLSFLFYLCRVTPVVFPPFSVGPPKFYLKEWNVQKDYLITSFFFKYVKCVEETSLL